MVNWAAISAACAYLARVSHPASSDLALPTTAPYAPSLAGDFSRSPPSAAARRGLPAEPQRRTTALLQDSSCRGQRVRSCEREAGLGVGRTAPIYGKPAKRSAEFAKQVKAGTAKKRKAKPAKQRKSRTRYSYKPRPQEKKKEDAVRERRRPLPERRAPTGPEMDARRAGVASGPARLGAVRRRAPPRGRRVESSGRAGGAALAG